MHAPDHFLFLASTGRSGTTITRRSLGLHPEIYYNGQENNVVQDVISAAKDNCSIQSRIRSMVVDQSQYDEAFRELMIRLIWPDEVQRNKPIWMAAINPNGEIMDYLAQVFPSTKVICLIRHPIGMISSRMRYDSFRQSTFKNHCETWMRSEGVYHWCQTNSDRGRVFRHEWLYSNALDERLSDLFDWIGLKSDSTVAENIRSKLVHPTGDATEGNSSDQSTRQAYFAETLDRWRDWTDANKHDFKDICGPFAYELGYELPF